MKLIGTQFLMSDSSNKPWTVWYSTESFSRWVIGNTELQKFQANGSLQSRKLYDSDASNPRHFHAMPTHLKNILYLDSPDIIIEFQGKPILSLEISTEAGTGHNVFQRFSRLIAAVENDVPAFYVYPEASWIPRAVNSSWDVINPSIFKAIEEAIYIHSIPILLFYYPTDFQGDRLKPPTSSPKGHQFDKEYTGQPYAQDLEMQKLFECVNVVIEQRLNGDTESTKNLKNIRAIRDQISWMKDELREKNFYERTWSPITATEVISTDTLLNHIYQSSKKYKMPEGSLLSSRKETLIYKVGSKFRGDPYPGALVAIDYLKCRNGRTFEDRDLNLVMAWGSSGSQGIEVTEDYISIHGTDDHSVSRFVGDVVNTYNGQNRVLLNRSYHELSSSEISRYMMQVRFGTTFTKQKHIRVYSQFCDAMLFHDGVLWREG